MTIEHKDIADPNRHEPKGASTATANTCYVSDGTGSGTWRQIRSTDLAGLAGDGSIAGLHLQTNGSNGFELGYDGIHGVMAITNNTTNFSVTAAADTSFNTTSQYMLVTGTGAPWASEYLNGISFDVDALTVPVDGIYKIDLWGNINGFPANNSKVSFRYKVNDTTFSSRKPTIKTNSVSDPRVISGFGLLQLSAGDYIQLYVASDFTGNILFNDLNTTLTLVRSL